MFFTSRFQAWFGTYIAKIKKRSLKKNVFDVFVAMQRVWRRFNFSAAKQF
jgi:hypothetical protein